MVVLRVKELLQSVESIRSHKAGSWGVKALGDTEERDVGRDKGLPVDIFGLEQLMRDAVGKSNKTMNKATRRGTQPEFSKAVKVFFNNWYAEVKFWNKRGMTGVWDQYHLQGVILGTTHIISYHIINVWPLLPLCLYLRVERMGCGPSVFWVCLMGSSDKSYCKVYQWPPSPIWGAMGHQLEYKRFIVLQKR